MILTRETLLAARPDFFRRQSPFKPCIQMVICGKPLATLAQSGSIFVARAGHRDKLDMRLHRQHSIEGDRDRAYWRRYYTTSHYTYCCYYISWDTLAIEQRSEHATRREALRYANILARK
jgi:hypothetical protein